MATSISGIDPDRLQEMSTVAGSLSSSADDWRQRSAMLVAFCDLEDKAFTVVDYCREVYDEMSLLSQLTADRAARIIEAANNGYELTAADLDNGPFMADLEDSLDDEIGKPDPSQVAELDPELAALLAKFDSKEDFYSKEYDDALTKALEEGDLETVAALTDLLWDTVGSIEDEKEAKQFLDMIPPEIIVVAVAESGVPPIQAVVDHLVNVGDFMERYVGPGCIPPDRWAPFRDAGAPSLHDMIMEHYGIDSRSIEDVPKLYGDQLSKFVNQHPDYPDMLLQTAFNENTFRDYKQFGPIAAVFRDVANKHPDLVLSHTNGDYWTQNFSDMLVNGASQEEISSIFNKIEDAVASQLQLNDKQVGANGGEVYSDSMNAFEGLARLEKTLGATGHGYALDYEAMAKLVIGEVPGGSTVNKALGVLSEDELIEQRKLQSDINDIKANRALEMMSRTHPAEAKALLEAMGVDETALGGIDQSTRDKANVPELKDELAILNSMIDQLDGAYAIYGK